MLYEFVQYDIALISNPSPDPAWQLIIVILSFAFAQLTWLYAIDPLGPAVFLIRNAHGDRNGVRLQAQQCFPTVKQGFHGWFVGVVLSSVVSCLYCLSVFTATMLLQLSVNIEVAHLGYQQRMHWVPLVCARLTLCGAFGLPGPMNNCLLQASYLSLLLHFAQRYCIGL